MSIPAHHSRQEECLTRPPYRQGRKITAVKVYTVAQESQWLLVQGVPNVGADHELAKLFAQYGDIDQCRLLADYPADDFCEAYLIKFKKIQSARYAKKKLDDWSFFGGVLHVSYAPEYESVQETREKLQDRRKVIAAKTRQYAKDGTFSSTLIHTQPHTSGFSHGQDSRGPEQLLFGTHSVPSVSSNPVPSVSSNSVPSVSTNSVSSVSTHSYNIESQSSDKKDIFSNRNYEVVCNNVDSSGYHPEQCLMSHQRKENGEEIEKSKNFMTETDLEEGTQMWIPLPPKVDPRAEVKKHSWKNYEFAWVPTANAPFPNDFDARLAPVSISNACCFIGMEKDSKEISQEQATIEKSDLKCETEKVCGTNAEKKSQVLIKDYKKPGLPPRFIPRQMVNKKSGKDKEMLDSKKEEDTLTQEIKKNAFILGAPQGPVAPDPTEIEREEKKEKEQERLMNELSSSIRKRVSQFSDVHLPKKKIAKSSATT